jgi:hypothetical protein
VCISTFSVVCVCVMSVVVVVVVLSLSLLSSLLCVSSIVVRTPARPRTLFEISMYIRVKVVFFCGIEVIDIFGRFGENGRYVTNGCV